MRYLVSAILGMEVPSWRQGAGSCNSLKTLLSEGERCCSCHWKRRGSRDAVDFIYIFFHLGTLRQQTVSFSYLGNFIKELQSKLTELVNPKNLFTNNSSLRLLRIWYTWLFCLKDPFLKLLFLVAHSKMKSSSGSASTRLGVSPGSGQAPESRSPLVRDGGRGKEE